MCQRRRTRVIRTASKNAQESTYWLAGSIGKNLDFAYWFRPLNGKLQLKLVACRQIEFLKVYISVNSKFTHLLSNYNPGCIDKGWIMTFEEECVKGEEPISSERFSQTQNNQRNTLQKQLERFLMLPPGFGFNSANCNLNLVKKHLVPPLVYEQYVEPRVVKKVEQIVFFTFWDVQLRAFVRFSWKTTDIVCFPPESHFKITGIEFFSGCEKLDD